MREIIGCAVSDGLLERWSSLLVREHAPFFVTEAALSLLPQGAVRLTRSEFNQMSPGLDLRDSYRTYDVKPEGAFVALIGAAEFRTLPCDARQALLRLQWKLGRGQIYDLNAIRGMLPVAERPVVEGAAVFSTPEGEKVALNYEVWHSLSPSGRWRWLLAFVSEDQPACLSGTLSREEWAGIERQHGSAVRRLAGTFAWSSGPNCFSTALAAATRSLPTAMSISTLWLHQGPFLRTLAERGYAPDDAVTETGPFPPGAILVWSDPRGALRHACYVVDDELALNKDSQAWFVPRRLVPIQSVLEDWREEGVSVRAYTPRP